MDSRPRVMIDHLVEAAAHAVWQPRPGQTVEFVGPRAPIQVQADPGLVGRIVGELVRNAADAIGGSGRVRVAVEPVRSEIDRPTARHQFDVPVPPGTYARISITDDGPRVPPDVKARLFEPFVSTKQPRFGGGLGLAVVYGIAQAVGWYVDAESEPGRTVFSVYMPLTSPLTSPAS